MSARRSVRLLASPTLEVWDVHCSAALGGPGPDEHSSVTQVILILDGVFEVHRGRKSTLADAASTVIFEAGWDHRVGHPTDRGDRSLVLVFPQETVADALEPGVAFGGPVEPATALGARALAAGLLRNTLNGMEAEDCALGLLGRISSDSGEREATAHRPSIRSHGSNTRALLAAEPERRWRLDELGRAVHCSPYHLARQFRSITGASVSNSLLRLRLALASERLAEGLMTWPRWRPTWGSRITATSARASDPCSGCLPVLSGRRSRPGSWANCARS